MTVPASVPLISTRWIQLSHFIYDHVLSKFYDRGSDLLRRRLIPLNKAAVDELHLKRGDRVVLFCCGTGQEFPFIQERIGPEGEILGVDWSAGVLERARRRTVDNGWKNVKLIKGDVTALPDSVIETASYDGGIVTAGLSIINEPGKAFQALKNAVKGGGRIVIGDVCSFSGIKSILNPFNTLICLAFGNTHRSLAHSRVFAETLPSGLFEAKLQWHVSGCYYIASGTRPDAL
jgi:ubiquinone/menaquinone biosynthesis C-methylase UbiE